MFKRLLFGLALLMTGLSVQAADPAIPAAAPGALYTELRPPLPTENANKIEVVEFFWYGCPHCYAIEPYVEEWLKHKPADVVFVRVPAMFNAQWAAAGRVFYTLESMGLVDRLHRPLFDAIHKDHLRITDEDQLKDWLNRQGVDVAKFQATLHSFTVESKVKRATQLTELSRIDGVPSMIVDGRYLVSLGQVQSPTRMLQVVDQQIAVARKGMKAPAKK
jgi:thiol:disulfide interchange protein DsbA